MLVVVITVAWGRMWRADGRELFFLSRPRPAALWPSTASRRAGGIGLASGLRPGLHRPKTISLGRTCWYPVSASPLAVLPTNAMADPILAVYSVKVVLRFNYSTGQYEDYSQPVFPLLMRFDPATTQVEHQYGTPGFSQVPLSAPDPPAGVPW